MTVVAPCRLHFGLFHVPVERLTAWPDGTPVRNFGGLGMMVVDPQVRVRVTSSRQFMPANGSLADRATAFAKVVGDRITFPSSGSYLRFHADGPPEHVGLGVGTALGMTLAFAANDAEGGNYVPQQQLPAVVGRGRRSGIGVHGFYYGGFIVDDGKLGDELPVLRERIDVPSDWRVVLARPPVPGAWHGEAERTAFRRRRSAAEALDTTSRLSRLASEFIVPALKRADFDTFAVNLTDFNRIAGEPFDDDQGGPYAGPAVAGIIDELLEWGVRGVGQSSWGPTVFAFARNEAEATELADRLRDRFPNLADLRVTAADNQGVRVLPDDQPG
jgi:beta-RFAP synthase